MARPTSLIEGSRAFARDFARDRMPRGYLWDMADWVPSLLDAELTSRGGWTWGSTATIGQIEAGIFAPFKAGDRLLVLTSSPGLGDISLVPPYTVTGVAGAVVPRMAQNPVMHRDWIFAFDRDGLTAPYVIKNVAGVLSSTLMSDASAPKGRYGTVYKDRLVVANIPGQEQQVRFSYPGFVLKDDPNTGNPVTMKWDANSFINSSLAVTAVASMRAMILVFHAGSVERIRGSVPPGTDISSDMFLEALFDRAGCTDARSIAFWNDNCIFADERGIHLTDGSIVRNLIAQAGLIAFWRTLYRAKLSIAAETYLDYYITTVRRSDGVAPVTLVIDLNRRSVFRFTNIDATCFIKAIGAQEKLWSGHGTTNRLMELSSCFFPVFSTTANADADGMAVLPTFETPWFRLGEEGRKRVRHAYLSYDVRPPGAAVAASWRAEDGMDPDAQLPGEAIGFGAVLGQPTLQVEYIKGPQETTWLDAGDLPATDSYHRRRLAVGKQPYGVAFRVTQIQPSSVTRIFDLAVEQWPSERSRL